MKTFYKDFPSSKNKLPTIKKETKELIYFDSFTLLNPETELTFPSSDEPYYTSLEYQLRHLLFKKERGWITSERQVIYTSDECISTIHFLYDENNKVDQVNVFQRSSNLLNIEDDIQFLNYFINKYLDIETVDLVIFNSMPHVFKHGGKLIED